MFVGLSVLQKECDEVFLNSHICSLDRRCHGKNATKFFSAAISCSLDLQCHGKHGMKFS